MSMTYTIACVGCRRKLWCGQARRGSKIGWSSYDYVDENGDRHLDRFLAEHQLHELRFFADDGYYPDDGPLDDWDDYEEQEYVEVLR